MAACFAAGDVTDNTESAGNVIISSATMAPCHDGSAMQWHDIIASHYTQTNAQKK